MTSKSVGLRNRAFYGWISLSGSLIVVFILGGIYIYTYAVFLPVMCAEFGWSRATMSAGVSIGMLAMGLPSMLSGFLVARFGPKINMVLGTLIGTLGLAGMSMVHEVWHVYLFWGIAGLGCCIGGYVPGTAIANNWFIRKRSLALGLYMASGGVGGFIFPPMATALIAAIGWRMTWLALAILNLVISTLIASLIMVKNRPEDIGQVPDGILDEPLSDAGGVEHLAKAKVNPPQWRTKQVLRQPTTWFIAVYGAAVAFSLGVLQTHQIAYLQDLGFSAMAAATSLSVVSALSVVGGLGFGLIALKVNIRYLACACSVVRMISLGILLTTDNIALIYVYAVLFGFTGGILSPVMAALLANYFGRDCYAQVIGIVMTVQVAANAASPFIAGVIYDITSTYTMAFVLSVAFSLVGLIFIFLSRQPRLPQPDIR